MYKGNEHPPSTQSNSSSSEEEVGEKNEASSETSSDSGNTSSFRLVQDYSNSSGGFMRPVSPPQKKSSDSSLETSLKIFGHNNPNPALKTVALVEEFDRWTKRAMPTIKPIYSSEHHLHRNPIDDPEKKPDETLLVEKSRKAHKKKIKKNSRCQIASAVCIGGNVCYGATYVVIFVIGTIYNFLSHKESAIAGEESYAEKQIIDHGEYTKKDKKRYWAEQKAESWDDWGLKIVLPIALLLIINFLCLLSCLIKFAKESKKRKKLTRLKKISKKQFSMKASEKRHLIPKKKFRVLLQEATLRSHDETKRLYLSELGREEDSYNLIINIFNAIKKQGIENLPVVWEPLFSALDDINHPSLGNNLENFVNNDHVRNAFLHKRISSSQRLNIINTLFDSKADRSVFLAIRLIALLPKQELLSLFKQWNNPSGMICGINNCFQKTRPDFSNKMEKLVTYTHHHILQTQEQLESPILKERQTALRNMTTFKEAKSDALKKPKIRAEVNSQKAILLAQGFINTLREKIGDLIPAKHPILEELANTRDQLSEGLNIIIKKEEAGEESDDKEGHILKLEENEGVSSQLLDNVSHGDGISAIIECLKDPKNKGALRKLVSKNFSSPPKNAFFLIIQGISTQGGKMNEKVAALINCFYSEWGDSPATEEAVFQCMKAYAIINEQRLGLLTDFLNAYSDIFCQITIPYQDWFAAPFLSAACTAYNYCPFSNFEASYTIFDNNNLLSKATKESFLKAILFHGRGNKILKYGSVLSMLQKSKDPESLYELMTDKIIELAFYNRYHKTKMSQLLRNLLIITHAYSEIRLQKIQSEKKQVSAKNLANEYFNILNKLPKELRSKFIKLTEKSSHVFNNFYLHRGKSPLDIARENLCYTLALNEEESLYITLTRHATEILEKHVDLTKKSPRDILFSLHSSLKHLPYEEGRHGLTAQQITLGSLINFWALNKTFDSWTLEADVNLVDHHSRCHHVIMCLINLIANKNDTKYEKDCVLEPLKKPCALEEPWENELCKMLIDLLQKEELNPKLATTLAKQLGLSSQEDQDEDYESFFDENNTYM